MKNAAPPMRSIICLLLAGSLFSAGCTIFTRPPAPLPSATLQGVTDDYRQAQRQTAATDQALEALEVTDLPDLKRSLDYFLGNLAMMEQIGQRLIAHADGMFYRGSYYFVESGNSLESCAYPRAAQLDNRPGIDLGPDFYAVSGSGEEVKHALRAFLFDIEQIHYLVGSNRTLAGIDTAEGLFRKAKVDAESLQYALRQALAALNQASKKVQQSSPGRG